jgi:hypothetical protein
VKGVRTWLTTTGAVTMLITVVNNNPGYSHNNRRSVVSKTTSYTLPFARFQASLPAKRVLVFGIRVAPVPKR